MANSKKDRLPLKGNNLPVIDEHEEIDPKLYNEIAKFAKLLSIQLVSSRFHILPSFFGKEDGLNLKIDFEEVHCSYDAESTVATAIFCFEVKALRSRKKVLSLKDEFLVAYQLIEKCDEFHGMAYASRVGIMACYPYFRAHAANTASLANAELPVLPALSRPPIAK